MNSDESEFQEVLVDVPKRDKDGNPISFDSLGPGGARNDNGTLKAQYRNPRRPKPADEPRADERTSHENDARRRREEEEAEERRRQQDFDRTLLLIDKYVIPFTKNYLIPGATKLWDTKGRPLWDTKVVPGGKRLAQRLFRPKMSEPEVPTVNDDASEFAAETANPLATFQHRSADQEAVEDTAVADVIQIDKYQDRRSA
jgi:hypothetical protein